MERYVAVAVREIFAAEDEMETDGPEEDNTTIRVAGKKVMEFRVATAVME